MRDLARRHACTVRLDRLVSGGLVATVTLPDALFEPVGDGATHVTRAEAWTTLLQATSPQVEAKEWP